LKIIADRELLAAAWGAAASVAPPKHPREILQNVVLVADESPGSDEPAVKIVANNLEAGIRRAVAGVQVLEGGSVVLPLKVGEIIRSIREQEISISSGKIGSDLLVASGRSKFEIPSFDPNLFPDVPDFKASDYWIIDAQTLKTAIRRTQFAIDAAETRWALGGVLFEFRDHIATFVATSGRAMAMSTADIAKEGNPLSSGMPIVPQRSLKIIEKAIADYDGIVHISIDPKNSILIRTDNATIYSRIMEGRFPDWRMLIPGGESTDVSLGAAAFLGGIKLAAIATSEDTRGIDFDFGDDLLTMTAAAPDRGSSRVEMECQNPGDPCGFRVDPYYLETMLASLGDSTVTVEMRQGGYVMFSADGNYRYLTAPMKV
jgi:DNA polymerase III subunit beta